MWVYKAVYTKRLVTIMFVLVARLSSVLTLIYIMDSLNYLNNVHATKEINLPKVEAPHRG